MIATDLHAKVRLYCIRVYKKDKCLGKKDIQKDKRKNNTKKMQNLKRDKSYDKIEK